MTMFSHRLTMILGCLAFALSTLPASADPIAEAEASADIAGASLSKVHRWLHEVALKKIDPDTGLYKADDKWNYRDTAADCYPFLIWAAHATDPDVLENEARAILQVERTKCAYLDRIPAPWDFEKGTVVEDFPHDELIFQASEYVKDGLIAITEVTGQGPWFDRMREIQDDIWKHARIDTDYGKIPSENVEVNGEQIQALVRLYTATAEDKYLEWAMRLADYYLSDPDFVPTRLRDHGCEIIGGLGLLMAVADARDLEKAEYLQQRMRTLFDQVLARGCNPDGFMLNRLAAKPGTRVAGKKDRGDDALSDGWGYNYVSYLCYDMVTGNQHYTPHIRQTLRNLRYPLYEGNEWGERGNIDGYADSIEGAIYLLNRVPEEEGFAWADREARRHVVRLEEDGGEGELWGTMKLEANGVRTTVMHALMHTRGLRAFPWRDDLKLGAAEDGDELVVVLKSDTPWEGELVFDFPRHKVFWNFQHDWPRMNTLPEWFTVQTDQNYKVTQDDTSSPQTGDALIKGLTVTTGPDSRLTLRVTPEDK
jgi:hypothetical protein